MYSTTIRRPDTTTRKTLLQIAVLVVLCLLGVSYLSLSTFQDECTMSGGTLTTRTTCYYEQHTLLNGELIPATTKHWSLWG